MRSDFSEKNLQRAGRSMESRQSKPSLLASRALLMRLRCGCSSTPPLILLIIQKLEMMVIKILTEDKFCDVRSKCSIRKRMKFKHNEGRNTGILGQYYKAHKRQNQTWRCEPTNSTCIEFWPFIVDSNFLEVMSHYDSYFVQVFEIFLPWFCTSCAANTTNQWKWHEWTHNILDQEAETSRPAASKSTSAWRPASQSERVSWKQQENSISRCAKSWNMFVLSSS